jgi:hypothetical protein
MEEKVKEGDMKIIGKGKEKDKKLEERKNEEGYKMVRDMEIER